MSQILASISRQLSINVPITIFQMLLSGRHAHKNRSFFMGLRGFSWVWIMGSQNVMGLFYGSNISAKLRWTLRWKSARSWPPLFTSESAWHKRRDEHCTHIVADNSAALDDGRVAVISSRLYPSHKRSFVVPRKLRSREEVAKRAHTSELKSIIYISKDTEPLEKAGARGYMRM
jgi:hypothetical protein